MMEQQLAVKDFAQGPVLFASQADRSKESTAVPHKTDRQTELELDYTGLKKALVFYLKKKQTDRDIVLITVLSGCGRVEHKWSRNIPGI